MSSVLKNPTTGWKVIHDRNAMDAAGPQNRSDVRQRMVIRNGDCRPGHVRHHLTNVEVALTQLEEKHGTENP
jgi:hypothetical protein